MVPSRFRTLILAALASLAFLSGCSSLNGTYADPTGAIVLDLRSGDKASLTFMGETASCGWTSSGKQITLNCPGQAGKTIFTVGDDGSLSGPPGSLIPALQKRK